MQVYDLTVMIHTEIPVWPGQPSPRVQTLWATAKGDLANVSVVSLSSHTGTHVDAPFHFMPNGKTLESVPVERLVGPVRVIEMDGESNIDAERLEAAVASGDLPPGTERLILKTQNTARRLMFDPKFHADYISITPDGARWLVDHGIKTIGVDYLSVEQFGQEKPHTHWTLLGAEVFIMEGLNLQDVPPGNYTLVCGSLHIHQCDGSPARIFLLPPYPSASES